MPSFLTQQPHANPRLPFPPQWSLQVIHQTSTLFSEAMNQWGCRNVAHRFQGEKPKLSVFGWITFTSQRLHNGLFKRFVHTTLSNPTGGKWSLSYLPPEWCLGKFEGPKADGGLGKTDAWCAYDELNVFLHFLKHFRCKKPLFLVFKLVALSSFLLLF